MLLPALSAKARWYMKDLDHARLMIEMARKDFKAIRGMADTDVFDESVFGFHAQQAVEKTLKAWFSSTGVEYSKTHDLRLLVGLLRDKGNDVTGVLDLIELNIYAVQFRYESYSMPDVPLDRQETVKAIERLIGQVEALLKQ